MSEMGVEVGAKHTDSECLMIRYYELDALD